jgi:hypothetical protein
MGGIEAKYRGKGDILPHGCGSGCVGFLGVVDGALNRFLSGIGDGVASFQDGFLASSIGLVVESAALLGIGS